MGGYSLTSEVKYIIEYLAGAVAFRRGSSAGGVGIEPVGAPPVRVTFAANSLTSGHSGV